ncbi:MAG: potassium channel family protein [Acidobacteriota bacterium]
MRTIWARWTDNPLAWPLAFMGVILAASAAGFAHLEAQTQAEPVSFFEGLWWAVVTLFTVGYGDFAPKTVSGRLLGMGVMASGIGIVSMVTATVASAMVERRNKKRRGLLPVSAQGHVLILGWNAHGALLVERLRRMREFARAPFVLAADMDPARFEEIAAALDLGSDLNFVRGDTSLRSTLERANPARARLIYILPSEDVPAEEADNRSVLTALTVRDLAPHVTLYAEALREQSRDHLLRAGVTTALGREELAGKAMAFLAVHPVMHDVLQALLTASATGAGQLASAPGASGESGGGLRYRPLTQAEKAAGWPDVVRNSLQGTGQLPLGVCRLPRELKLEDVLDASQALDSYIMELFQAAGRSDSLGSQEPRVVLNPGPGVDLAGFDGVVSLDNQS